MRMVQKVSGCILLTVLIPLTVFATTDGRTDMLEAEKQITVDSYQPTYPEIQLGYATDLRVDESGTVSMDTEEIQGALDENGFLYIEGVKGQGDTYFVIEKGGYVLAIQARADALVSHDGKVVQIKLVEWLYGRNGLADADGFKSNLVPEGFLPKTGLEESTGDGLSPKRGGKQE